MRALTVWPLHLAGGICLRFLWSSEEPPGNPGTWVTGRGYHTDFTEEWEGALKISIPQENISPGISSLPCVSKDCSRCVKLGQRFTHSPGLRTSNAQERALCSPGLPPR